MRVYYDPLALSALHARSMEQKKEGATSAIDVSVRLWRGSALHRLLETDLHPNGVG